MELYTSIFTKKPQRFFRYEHYIVGVGNVYYDTKWISIFNLYNKESIIHQLSKVDKVEYVHYMIDYGHQGIVIDVINKTWSIVEFPYSINKIDGNMINMCYNQGKNKEKFYLFHSHTYDYQTGVFIYDVETNTFNHEDFFIDPTVINDNKNDDNDDDTLSFDNPEQTNRFKSLHNKNIYSCYIDDRMVLYDGEEVFYYDPETDVLTSIMKIDEKHCINEIKRYKNQIIGIQHYKKETDTKVYIYSNPIVSFVVADKEDYVVFWDIYENYLIIITETFVNPYGQIYGAKHDRTIKLKVFSI